MASPVKHWKETVEYTRLDAAKLLCQYDEYVQLALDRRGSFFLWYHSQEKEDLELMLHDQKTRKVKQGSKIAGKVVGNIASVLLLGVGGYSQSPVKDIAVTAVIDEEIWLFLFNNNITYSILRKM